MMNALFAHAQLDELLAEYGSWDSAAASLDSGPLGTPVYALRAASRALAGHATSAEANALEDWAPEPRDTELRLAALAAVYHALRDPDALTEVALERRAGVAEPSEGDAILAELALVLTSLAPDAEATDLVCSQAFDVAPAHVAAINAVIALRKRRSTDAQQTYEELLEGVARASRGARDSQLAPLHRALGFWARDELRDDVLAEGHLSTAFELDPTNEPTQRWLLDTWRDAGDPQRVGLVLAARVEQAPGDEARLRELLSHLAAHDEWSRWADALTRWLTAADETAAPASSPVDLIIEHARILAEQLANDAGAIDALRRGRAAYPDDAAIAAALLSFNGAVDATERAECATTVASASAEPADVIAASDAWVAAGDPGRAHALAMSLPSLDAVPGDLLRQIAEIAELARAYSDAARVWERAAETVEGETRAECFRRAGLAAQAGGEPALGWLEAAVAAAPARRDLVEALATEAQREEDWASARAALAAVCSMAHAEGANDAPWEALAHAESQLGHHDAAAQAWGMLIEARPEPLVLHRAADALARIATVNEDWATMAPLLPHHTLLAGTDIAGTAYALGRCFADTDDADNARAWLSQVIALSPAHQGALRWLALHGESESADAIMGLLRGTQEPSERFALLLRLARARRTAGDWEDAVAAYELAAESDQRAVEPLHHLLSLHMERQHWPLAIDVLGRLSKRAPELAPRLNRAAGALYLEELRDPANAVACFRRALAADPTDRESQEALLGILRSWGEPEPLAEALTDAYTAAPTVDLALELGDLLAGPLRRYDEAVALWKSAAKTLPNSLPLLERVTKAYSSSGKPDAQLMSEHWDVLRVAIDRPDSHYALFAAYKRERAFDRAWLHAAALRVLGDDAKPARDFVAEHRRDAISPVRRPWSEAEWREVLPQFGGEATWQYIETLGHLLQHVTARTPADWGLDARRDVQRATALPELTELWGYGCAALGLPVASLWLSDQHAGVMQSGATDAALVLGPDIARSPADRATAFRLFRGLALLHPRLRGVACVAHPESLTALVSAASALAHDTDADGPLVSRWLGALRREHVDVLTQLKNATLAFEKAGGHASHAQHWPAVIEQVACCVALTLTGSLSQSIEAIRNEPAALGSASLSDRLLDMVRFWVSDAHAHLRAELGIGVGQL